MDEARTPTACQMIGRKGASSDLGPVRSALELASTPVVGSSGSGPGPSCRVIPELPPGVCRCGVTKS